MAEKQRPKPRRHRLGRLVVCLGLFLAVFWGRGTDWTPARELTQSLGDLLDRDMGVQETFARVGKSFSRGAPAAETVRNLLTGLDWTQKEESGTEPEEEPQTTDTPEEPPHEDSDGEG